MLQYQFWNVLAYPLSVLSQVPAAEADAMVDTVTAMEPAAVVTEIVAQVEKLSLEDELLAAEPGRRGAAGQSAEGV